jgi:NADH-quinone oxidoreductase subunit G
LVVLSRLVTAAGGSAQPADLAGLWVVIAAEVPALAHAAHAKLPEAGLLLDATPWASQPFVEGETLHYKPGASIG